MLLTLLVSADAGGVYSSRRIERLCREDVAYRVICALDVPDHATIARFRRAHFGRGDTLRELFTEVLVLAGRAGLGRLGNVALDGTKLAADAAQGGQPHRGCAAPDSGGVAGGCRAHRRRRGRAVRAGAGW